MLKALSPMISVTLLIVISLTLASLIAPWMYELVTTTTNETSVDVRQQIKCRSAGLDFDSQYKNYGADWNFTGNTSDWIDEVNHLVWNDDGTKSDGRYADHATDAGLYGWREARHYLFKAQEEQPAEILLRFHAIFVQAILFRNCK